MHVLPALQRDIYRSIWALPCQENADAIVDIQISVITSANVNVLSHFKLHMFMTVLWTQIHLDSVSEQAQKIASIVSQSI